MVKVALIELLVENLVVREEEVHGGGRKEELLLCIPSPSAFLDLHLKPLKNG